MNKIIVLVIFGFVAVPGSAWAARYNPYEYHQGMTQNNVLLGHIIAVQPVQGSAGAGNLGSVIGGVAGLALGNKVGRGAGKLLATVAGGIFGGIFGSRIEQHLSRQSVNQITVRLRDGRIIAVVEKEFQFHPGQEVQVIYSPGSSWGQRGTVRVLPL